MLATIPSRPLKINLSAVEYRAQPFASFGRLREMGILVPARLPLIGKTWLVTTYQAVNDVLKDDRRFCRDPRHAGTSNFLIFQLMMPGLFKKMSQNMLAKDEPDHRRLRTLVDQAFQRQSITDLRPRMEEITAEQLQRVAQVAAANRGTVDLVEHLARPIPATVTCELLGLPHADRPKFQKWFASFSEIKSVWGLLKVVPGLRKTLRYLRDQFEQVRRHPRPGLITALVEAEQSGDRLSDEELQSMVMLLLIAGHETTVHLISTSILTMFQLPEVNRELQADWSKVDAAVEEMLRYNSPAQFAKPRFVTEDTEFYGQPLKRGEMVMPVLAAANYDPARFDRPAEFIIDRPDNHHVSFGNGPHVCLGLKLARAEARVVLQQLFTGWPGLEPAFDPSRPEWSRRMGMRALKTLAATIKG